jgi:hypothetical protein
MALRLYNLRARHSLFFKIIGVACIMGEFGCSVWCLFYDTFTLSNNVLQHIIARFIIKRM